MSEEAPKPSLCDNCIHAYKVPGGSITIESTDGVVKSFPQRYCPKRGISIHTRGKEKCKWHKPEKVIKKMERDRLEPDRYAYLSKEDSDLYDRCQKKEVPYEEALELLMKFIEGKAASCEASHRAHPY